MWTVEIHVEKPRGKNGDSSYGDFSVGLWGKVQVGFPQRKEKIFKSLRDKHGNPRPYCDY